MILDSKLSFINHLKEKISIANKGIGIIRRLYNFLPRFTLINIYKAYVRPHLDYGDIIYDNSSKGRVTHNDILRIFCKYTELFNFKNILKIFLCVTCILQCFQNIQICRLLLRKYYFCILNKIKPV